MAKRHTTPTQLLLAMKKRFEVTQLNAKQMHAVIARQCLADAIELTSGRVSKAELRRAGHPFGRGASAAVSEPGALKRGGKRGARGKYKDLPINRQSGRLVGGFRLTRESKGIQSFGIRNAVPYRKFILSPTGTRKMVARGYAGSSGETMRRGRRYRAALLLTLRDRQRKS